MFFSKKTVDNVLAGFQRTVQDLRDIASREQETVLKNEAEITELMAASREATAEVRRANNIADKLAALIS